MRVEDAQKLERRWMSLDSSWKNIHGELSTFKLIKVKTY